MLEINDIVVYATTGVCKVEGIEEKFIGKTVKKYYLLRPIAQAGSAIYLPADNEQLIGRTRPVICSKEANKLLDSIKDDNRICLENESVRREFCRNAIQTCNSEDLISVIVVLRKLRSELLTESKRLHVADERALSEAERLICDEFSVSLGVDASDILNRINLSL